MGRQQRLRPSRFDNVKSFGSSYSTPGWQRAQANRARGQGGRQKAADRPAAASTKASRHSRRAERYPGRRGDGFRRNKRGPMTIEGELIAKSTGTVSEFSLDDRVFHQKFGYGQVVKIDGNKLTIAFEKAGEKKVVDSFVERAYARSGKLETWDSRRSDSHPQRRERLM